VAAHRVRRSRRINAVTPSEGSRIGPHDFGASAHQQRMSLLLELSTTFPTARARPMSTRFGNFDRRFGHVPLEGNWQNTIETGPLCSHRRPNATSGLRSVK
jgi:hypothetical protein